VIECPLCRAVHKSADVFKIVNLPYLSLLERMASDKNNKEKALKDLTNL
jgi:hypothetical protein